MLGVMTSLYKLVVLVDFETINGPLKPITYDEAIAYKTNTLADVIIQVTCHHPKFKEIHFFKAPLFFCYIKRTDQNTLVRRYMRAFNIPSSKTMEIQSLT